MIQDDQFEAEKTAWFDPDRSALNPVNSQSENVFDEVRRLRASAVHWRARALEEAARAGVLDARVEELQVRLNALLSQDHSEKVQ